MTLSELLYYGKKQLQESDCDNAYFDSLNLLESISDLTKTEILLNHFSELPHDKTNLYKALIARRCNGEPLQYLLGNWEFMGFKFFIGPGVLIPRRETEGLVEIAIAETDYKKEPVIFDLCAGSGCVGISIAKYCPGAKVFLVENSPEALAYMKHNIQYHKLSNTTAVYGDVNDGFHAFNLPAPDIILANPPYIPTCELDYLQEEVKYEPKQAFDGGIDGLDFYRTINEKWLPFLSLHGVLAVECGDDQADKIAELLPRDDYEIQIRYDVNNIKRIVVINNNHH